MSEHLRRTALGLAYFTVGYNILEGIASLAAGYLAGSIALTGFGLDSFVESLSGGIMIWRLGSRPHIGDDAEEHRERRAVRLIGISFFVFAAYVLFESARKLYLHDAPDPSLFGIVIAVASLIVMPILYVKKKRVGTALGMRSIIADSKETLACVYLSVSLLAGLVLNAVFGLWWADPAVGLLVAVFLFREGREAFEDGEDDE
mgnify:CR=1 FL=1